MSGMLQADYVRCLSENRPRSTLIQAIFILGCGCDVKNLGPAMLVYPKIAREVCRIRLFSWFVVAGAEKTGQPCWFI
ncbi:MAG: hypothetical protein L3J49_08065, partial [Desulfobulbaceae bacterium]|nr:hypothetical protein [Desulfobulbaceae bacterium]